MMTLTPTWEFVIAPPMASVFSFSSFGLSSDFATGGGVGLSSAMREEAANERQMRKLQGDFMERTVAGAVTIARAALQPVARPAFTPVRIL